MPENAEKKPSRSLKLAGWTARRGGGALFWTIADFLGTKDAAIMDVNAGAKKAVGEFVYHIGFPLSSAAIAWKHSKGEPHIIRRVVGNTAAVLGLGIDIAAWHFGGPVGRAVEGGIISVSKGVVAEIQRPIFKRRGR